ncbi:MAG: hypothetical protein ACC613_04140 [Synergistales bacterium]
MNRLKRPACLVALLLLAALLERRGALAASPAVCRANPGPVKIALLLPEGLRGKPLARQTRIFLEGKLGQPLEARGMSLRVEEIEIPLSPAEASERLEQARREGASSALSLLPGPQNAYLSRVAKPPFPIVLAWSEEVSIHPGNDPFLFGIDFEESFRPKAWAIWARTEGISGWFFFTDSLDNRLKRLREKTEKEFSRRGFDFRSYRLQRNTPQQNDRLLRDSLQDGGRAFLLWLSPSQAASVGALLAFHGERTVPVCFGKGDAASFPLSGRYRFLTQDPNGGDQAAKARLAATWLVEAFLAGPVPPEEPEAVSRALERIRRIEGAGEEIRLGPEQHRPIRKAVFFLRPRDGSMEIVERMVLDRASGLVGPNAR